MQYRNSLYSRQFLRCHSAPSVVSSHLIMAYLPYAQIVLAILLIAGIVLQQRGSSLGGAFGGDNFASTFYKRRGAEKFLFNATIFLAILFVGTALISFVYGSA